jgi:hypothetical protein
MSKAEMMRKTRQFLLPAEAHIAPAEVNIAVGRILLALTRSKVPAISAAGCQREFERKYPELCERYHLSGEFLRTAFRSVLLTNSAVSGALRGKWQTEGKIDGFAKDSPPDRRRIAARFARMSGSNLRMTLEAAREMMRDSKRETWAVQIELAEAEIQRRGTKAKDA